MGSGVNVGEAVAVGAGGKTWLTTVVLFPVFENSTLQLSGELFERITVLQTSAVTTESFDELEYL